MEHQKSQSRQSAYNTLRKAFRSLEDMKIEFKKIQWTEDKKIQEYAKIVVLATFASGMVLYFADVIVHKFLWALNACLRMLFG